MRKTIAVFLVFSLLCLSGSLYAEKKGAEIVIHKKDGQQAKGELIAVKEDSLLLMENVTGADVSVRVDDIKKVTIVKKSNALIGAGMGLLILGGGGAVIGLAQGGDWLFSAEDMALIYGAIFGLIGLLAGGIGGAMDGIDKTIQFEGISDPTIRVILIELRKKARITDFQ